jgi:hypothetical protein
MAASVAGVAGPVPSAAFLLLVLALVATLVVFMVTRPRWLAPPARGPDEPPRPISEMTSQELADWSGGDPEKLRRLMRRRRF